MANIPRTILATFGEFIVEHNKMDYKLKSFLASFVEDELVGHLLTASQPFEFVRRRVNSIYNHLIDPLENSEDLIERWNKLQPEIKDINEIRNDIAHSIINLDTKTHKTILLTRFTENSVLKFSQKDTVYSITDLKKFVTRLKKLNRQLSYLLHSTYKRHNDIIYYDGKGMMF